MSSKDQTHSKDKAASKQRSSQPKTQNFKTLTQHDQPATIIQRARLDPRSLTPQDVQHLQRTIGNRAVDPLLTKATQNTNQTRLRRVEQRKSAESAIGIPVQRQEGLEEEEELQMKAESATAQQQELEEEESLQGKFTTNGTSAQRQGDGGKTENRTGIPNSLKAGLETLSGMDLSGVRVHHNSDEPARLNALAYTQGRDIYVSSGQEKHLAHEGWHAVQQKQGRVASTMQEKGVPVNDSRALEHEADVMGAKAEQHIGESGQENRSGFGDAVKAHHDKKAIQQQQNPVAQRWITAAGAFLGLSAEAWSTAGTVAGVVATVGGAAAATYVGVRPGDNAFGSLVLQGGMSAGDQRKLKQIIQFRIIDAYVERYLARPENSHIRDELMGGGTASGGTTPPTTGGGGGTAPSTTGGGGGATPSAAPPGPTGAPTASGIDQAVLTAVVNDIQAQLETLLETDPSPFNAEFMWGEDDTRGIGTSIGGSGSAESVGVTGFLRYRNMHAVALRETLSLSPEALAAVGTIPGHGTEVVVHKFIGGSVGGHATWSAWDNLAVNIDGGAALPVTHSNGSIKFIIRTTWHWDRWGPNSVTYMQNEIFIRDDGGIDITVSYEDTP